MIFVVVFKESVAESRTSTQAHEPETQKSPRSLPLGFIPTTSQSGVLLSGPLTSPSIHSGAPSSLRAPGLVVSGPAVLPIALPPATATIVTAPNKNSASALSSRGAPPPTKQSPNSLASHPKTCAPRFRRPSGLSTACATVTHRPPCHVIRCVPVRLGPLAVRSLTAGAVSLRSESLAPNMGKAHLLNGCITSKVIFRPCLIPERD